MQTLKLNATKYNHLGYNTRLVSAGGHQSFFALLLPASQKDNFLKAKKCTLVLINKHCAGREYFGFKTRRKPTAKPL